MKTSGIRIPFRTIRQVATLAIAIVLAGSYAVYDACAQPQMSPVPTSSAGGGSVKVPNVKVPNDPLVALAVADASLHDVASFDVDRVVAVGDRGAILLSESGGRNWGTVPSQTTANLHGIEFLSAERGLIVGGWIGNITRSSHAVILQSSDGGRQWTPIPCEHLPRLTGIRAQGSRLIAWGDYSPHWKSSVFESRDGGLNWNAVAMEIGHASAAAIAADEAVGTVGAVDRLGRACFVDQETHSIHIANPSKPMNCLHHTGSTWLACGAGGELIASLDGRTWTNVSVPLSSAARELCAWQSIGQYGDRVWVCGSPGSILLVSTDRGATWNLKRTGQSLPLTSIHFADQYRGWATGPMGLLLATRDGGETWYAQRQRTGRLSVLAVASSPTACPWAPLAAAAWDEQVATAATLFTELDPIAEADFLPTTVSAHADIAPQLGLANHHTHSNVSIESTQFTRQLALELLSWRPDVLLTGDSPPSSTQTTQLLSTKALEALSMANAPDAILGELGLDPWSVSKLMETCEQGSGSTTELASRVLRGPGIAVADCLFPLPPADRQAAGSTAMRMVWAQTQSSAASTALLGAIAPSETSARQLGLRDVGNFQMVLGRVHREKTMDLLATTTTDESSMQQWKDSLDFVLQTLPKRELAAVLHDLACRLSPIHNWEQRKLVYQRIISFAPASDAADWARLEQLRLDASDEIRAWRAMSHSSLSGSEAMAAPSDMPQPLDGASLKFALASEPSNATPFGHVASQALDRPKATVVTASAVSASDRPLSLHRSILPNWLQVVQQTTRDSQDLLSRPDLRLLLNRAQQRWPEFRELNTETRNPLLELVSTPELVGWPQMATQEMALLSHQTNRLRWKTAALETEVPPVLDGQLNDACWSENPGMVLEAFGDASQRPERRTSVLRWSFDRNYLYIAIDCPRAAGSGAMQLVDHRDYDADLSRIDHVQLTLDTDRDYCTAIDLAVSADGRTYDRCCGFMDFNPKWHVCVKSTAEHWIAEIAVNLSALTTQPDPSGQAWAVSARRLLPGSESQSWSQLRSHQAYLRASGLLLFTPRQVTSSLSDRE